MLFILICKVNNNRRSQREQKVNKTVNRIYV